MNENEVGAELREYYKEQTRAGEEGYIDNNSGDVRYNQLKEKIQYFEQKIFEAKLKEFMGQGFSREVAEKKAKKEAWIDWQPFLLQNVKITNKIEDEFAKNKEEGLKQYKNRLRQKLTPQFERIAVMRDLANAECINFSTTSFAQILDFIVTLTGVIVNDDGSGGDIVELTFDKFKEGDYKFDLADLKVNKVADKMKRLANRSADYASSEAVGLAKKVKNDTTGKIFDMSLKATNSEANEFDFSEMRENMNEVIGDFLGDFAAVEYPGWHATALMIKKKYREEIDKQGVENVMDDNLDYIMAFYSKEVVLNIISAAIMEKFMELGVKSLKKAAVYLLTGPGLVFLKLGLLGIFAGPAIADQVREYLANRVDVEKFLEGNLSESLELSLPEDFMKKAHQKALDRYNLTEKLAGYDELFYPQTIKVNGEELNFVIKNSIDGPGAWLGLWDSFKQIGHTIGNKIYDAVGIDKKMQFFPLKVENNLQAIEETVKLYNEDITKFEGIEEVYGEITDVSKLYKYYKNNTGSSIGIKGFFNPKVKDWLKKYQKSEEKYIDLGEEVLEELSHFHYTKEEGACIIVQDEKLGQNTGSKNDYKFLREVEEKITLQGNTMKTVLPALIKQVQKNFPKNKFSSFYKKDQIELIHYTPNKDPRDDARGMDSFYYHLFRKKYDCESEHHYKVVFKSLDEIAKIKGIKSREIKRARLKQGEIITDKKWCTIKKVMEANIKLITGGPYQFNQEVLPLGYRISNDGSFVILYNSKADKKNREKLSDVKFPPYEANHNIFYGSADKENKPQGKTEKFELQIGTHHRYEYRKKPKENVEKSKQLISNPNSKLLINGQRIGAPGKLKRLNKVKRGFVNRKLKRFKYYQDIKMGDKTLRIRYCYDLNGGWIKGDRSLFDSRWSFDSYLRIKYRIKGNTDLEWNTLTIKEFSDGDYGINIPDKGEVLAGSGLNRKIDPEGVELENVDIKEVVDSGRGKIKIKDKYLKAENLTEIKKEELDKRVVWKVNQGETLSEIADLYYQDSSRWDELEKEDGSKFTEEEAKNLEIGSKVYIPSDDRPIIAYKDQNNNTYVKNEQGDLFITYVEDDDKSETLSILGFEEGDYGLWIEEEAPYYFKNGKVFKKDETKQGTKGEVLPLAENKFLKEEDRIKDNFLWIYPSETIVFPKQEEKENKEEKNKTKIDSGDSSKPKERAETNSTDNNSKQAKDGVASSEKSQNSSQGGKQFYVCSGAELKCSFGDKNSKLQVVSDHNAKVCGNLIANIMDFQAMTNIQPFGKCQTTNNPEVASATAANHGNLTPQPCIPNIQAAWAKVKKDVKVGQHPALLEGSKLVCFYGGQIEIVDPGQNILKE
ncbi:MAG: DUF4280 domain-containing protein [Bacillota bacterium]